MIDKQTENTEIIPMCLLALETFKTLLPFLPSRSLYIHQRSNEYSTPEQHILNSRATALNHISHRSPTKEKNNIYGATELYYIGNQRKQKEQIICDRQHKHPIITLYLLFS